MDEQLLHELERQVRESARIISRMQNAMRVAGKYRASPSPDESELSVLWRTVEGIQAQLLKAAEASYRPRNSSPSRRR